MNKIKVEIYCPKSKGHQDSFWYDGDIALLSYKNRRVLVVAAGDIRIQKKGGELVHDGWKERGDGIKLETDKDLEKIGNSYDDKYYWENNNWFEFFWRQEDDNNWNDIMGDVVFEYDTALERAKTILKDNRFWKDYYGKEKKKKEKK